MLTRSGASTLANGRGGLRFASGSVSTHERKGGKKKRVKNIAGTCCNRSRSITPRFRLREPHSSCRRPPAHAADETLRRYID